MIREDATATFSTTNAASAIRRPVNIEFRRARPSIIAAGGCRVKTPMRTWFVPRRSARYDSYNFDYNRRRGIAVALQIAVSGERDPLLLRQMVFG